MKKSIFICLVLAIACMMGMSGCKGCSKGEKENAHAEAFSTDYDGVLPDLSEGAEHIIALHRQMMGKYGEYVWYEAKFTLADTIGKDMAEAAVVEVTDVFQTFLPDLCYIITTNAARGTLFPSPTPGLWIEDFDLSNEEIKLTVGDAVRRLAEWDGILPPFASVVLRKPVGPVPCNAQYVVGNAAQAVWVDAVTGEVSDTCPAFRR